MAESTSIPITDVATFKQKALQWANRFRVVCLLTNNGQQPVHYSNTEWLLCIDALEEVQHPAVFEESGKEPFERLLEFRQKNSGVLPGFLSYDLKNELEQLHSRNEDLIGFPLMYFFKPRYILQLDGNRLTVNRNYPETFELLERIEAEQLAADHKQNVTPQLQTGREEYIQNVQAIRQQIEEGTYYEINYCIEYTADDVQLDTVHTFTCLNEKSGAPFSCFVKHNDSYLMCASPERFLKKTGQTVIAQPIKGTAPVGKTAAENETIRQQLYHNEKERAENVMIVDLMRNDLARSCKPGTVITEELFGIYTFKSVNQMISTIRGEIRGDVPFTDAIRNAFPMGSMTGAPKVKVMEHIDRLETFRRGLFSGSVGYVDEQNNFDLNVVIRCILYNASTGRLEIPVGSAITYDSVPEEEWKEVLLKAQKTLEALG